MNRRGFLALLGLAPIGVAAVRAESSVTSDAFVPMPDGRRIPVTMGNHSIEGSANAEWFSEMDAKLKAAQKEATALIQRNFGQMRARYDQRSGV